MREIKFRAIMAGTDNWIYGYPFEVYENGIDSIQNSNGCEYIRVDTLGQFTGLIDKNGKEIYEGDIFSEMWKAEVYKDITGAYMIKFHTNPKINKPLTLYKYLKNRELAGTAERDCIIIGNVFENSELL